jgi:hypothetical protein
MMLVNGVILIGLFFLPWQSGREGLLFSWDVLGRLNLLQFIARVYLIAVGVVLLTAGVLPLPSTIRGAVGVVLGVFPLLIHVLQADPWPTSGLVAASLLLSAALLAPGALPRKRSWRSTVSKIIAAGGLAGILSTILLPINGEVPLVRLLTGPGLGVEDLAALIQNLLSLLLVCLGLVATLAVMLRWGAWICMPLAFGIIALYPVQTALQHTMMLWSPQSSFNQLGGIFQAVSLLLYAMVVSVGLAHILFPSFHTLTTTNNC